MYYTCKDCYCQEKAAAVSGIINGAGGLLVSGRGSYTLIWLIGGALAAGAAIVNYTVREEISV